MVLSGKPLQTFALQNMMLDNINYFKWAKFFNIYSRNINHFKVPAPTTTRTTEYFLEILDGWIDRGRNECTKLKLSKCFSHSCHTHVSYLLCNYQYWLIMFCVVLLLLQYWKAIMNHRWAFQNVKEAFHMQLTVLSSHLSQLLNDLLICRYPECSLRYFVQ